MQIKILKDWGNLKKDQVIDATGNTSEYLLSNGIACIAPKSDNCIGDCDDHDGECEGCKSKKKKRTGSGATFAPPVDDSEKTIAPVAKKKTTKKTASPKK